MRRQYPQNVRRITAIIGGKTYCYRSEGEYMWAQYLEFLNRTGQIEGWNYEPTTFYFENEKTAPVQYTPDFRIKDKNNGWYYQEFKRGSLDGQAVTKLRRMAKHYPDVIIELVMMNKSKKDTHRLYIIKKYVRRIISADIIFKQLGRLIISAKDYRLTQKLQTEAGKKLKELQDA